jgi:hypothetical protein
MIAGAFFTIVGLTVSIQVFGVTQTLALRKDVADLKTELKLHIADNARHVTN